MTVNERRLQSDSPICSCCAASTHCDLPSAECQAIAPYHFRGYFFLNEYLHSIIKNNAFYFILFRAYFLRISQQNPPTAVCLPMLYVIFDDKHLQTDRQLNPKSRHRGRFPKSVFGWWIWTTYQIYRTHKNNSQRLNLSYQFTDMGRRYKAQSEAENKREIYSGEKHLQQNADSEIKFKSLLTIL